MDSTSASLLRRLQQPGEQAAWQRFVEVYAPLIFHWAASQGLNATDSADLVQDVMVTLVDKLPEFQYDPKRRFRGWLRTVTVNRARNFLREDSLRPSSGLDDSTDSVSVQDTTDLFAAAEYRKFLVKRALRVMQTEFQEPTWRACWLHLAEGQPAPQVAHELGISTNAVYIAKCRVMRRLRSELEGLME